jgi:hypothetical protein
VEERDDREGVEVALSDHPTRRLVVWEALHDNGWTTLVIEQPDGTCVAWAGLGEAIGVDYVDDTPKHAHSPQCSR